MKFTWAALITGILLTALGFQALANEDLEGTARQSPAATIFDLTNWDPSHGPTTLEGLWKVKWNQIVDPGLFDKLAETDVQVPDSWPTSQDINRPFNRSGYATYGVTILLPNHQSGLVLDMGTIPGANRVFFDGRLIGSKGYPSSSAKDEVVAGWGRTGVVPLITSGTGGPHQIVVQTSNHNMAFGGMRHAMKIGLPENLARPYFLENFAKFGLLAIGLFLALYYIVLFASGPKDPTLLALTCLLIGLSFSIVSTTPSLLLIVPDASGSIVLKSGLISLIIIGLSALRLPQAYFPAVGFPRLTMALTIVAGIATVTIMFLPLRSATMLYPSAKIGMAGLLFVAMIISLRAAMQQLRGAWGYLATAVLMNGALIYGVVTHSLVGQHPDLVVYSSLLFGIFGQVAVMGARIWDSLQASDVQKRQLEEFNASLERTIRTRTKEVEEANLDLQEANAALKSEVDLKNKANEELMDSERRFRNIADRSPHPIIILHDELGEIYYVNDAAVELFELYHSTLDSVLSVSFFKDPERQLELRRKFFQEGSFSMAEATLIKATGVAFESEISAVPINYEGNPCAYTVVNDISERKKIERQRSEFVSTVSHELKTPLASITGSLGLIRGGVAGALTKQVESLADIAYNNCERLGRLINNILDVQRIEAGLMTIRRAPVLPTTIISEALECSRSIIDQRDIRVLTETDCCQTILVDKDLIVQVITNFISNAAKFSDPGATVVIRTKRYEDQLRLEVEDNGPGIDAAFRPHIFERFTQADGSDAGHRGGSGLGLSICKTIAEAHSINIGYNTPIEGGAIFYIDVETTSLAQSLNNSIGEDIRQNG